MNIYLSQERERDLRYLGAAATVFWTRSHNRVAWFVADWMYRLESLSRDRDTLKKNWNTCICMLYENAGRRGQTLLVKGPARASDGNTVFFPQVFPEQYSPSPLQSLASRLLKFNSCPEKCKVWWTPFFLDENTDGGLGYWTRVFDPLHCAEDCRWIYGIVW